MKIKYFRICSILFLSLLELFFTSLNQSSFFLLERFISSSNINAISPMFHSTPFYQYTHAFGAKRLLSNPKGPIIDIIKRIFFYLWTSFFVVIAIFSGKRKNARQVSYAYGSLDIIVEISLQWEGMLSHHNIGGLHKGWEKFLSVVWTWLEEIE